MTGALVASTAVIGVLACLNLVLTYGVIRRLREHSDQLAQVGSGASAQPPAGTVLPDFSAVATDETTVTRQSLSQGVTFIGFFSTTCPPCREQLPVFVDLVAPVGREHVLTVISDDDHDSDATSALVDLARSAGRVVVEQPMGALATALGVNLLPTMLVIDDGVVTVNAQNTEQLRTPIPT